jgi:hypothetical protein
MKREVKGTVTSKRLGNIAVDQTSLVSFRWSISYCSSHACCVGRCTGRICGGKGEVIPVHAVKACRGIDPPILNFGAREGECLMPHVMRFTPGRWMGSRARLEVLEKKKCLVPAGDLPRTVQLMAEYTECNSPVPVCKGEA